MIDYCFYLQIINTCNNLSNFLKYQTDFPSQIELYRQGMRGGMGGIKIDNFDNFGKTFK